MTSTKHTLRLDFCQKKVIYKLKFSCEHEIRVKKAKLGLKKADLKPIHFQADSIQPSGQRPSGGLSTGRKGIPSGGRPSIREAVCIEKIIVMVNRTKTKLEFSRSTPILINVISWLFPHAHPVIHPLLKENRVTC